MEPTVAQMSSAEDRERLCDFLFLAGVQHSAASLRTVEKNAAGRAAQLMPQVRLVYPDKHLPFQLAGELARFCFPHGVLPSPRPQPICSFVTAVTGGTGDRLFLHVVVFPERYGTRLWVPACVACAGRVLLPGLFRPYLEQLQLRWAAFAALQAGLSSARFGAQVAADFASSWTAMTSTLALAPDLRLPPPGKLTAFELGDTLFCFATPPLASPDSPAQLTIPTLPKPPPTRTHLEITKRLHVPLPPALAARLLGLMLTGTMYRLSPNWHIVYAQLAHECIGPMYTCTHAHTHTPFAGSQCLLFSRSATLLTLALEGFLELLSPFKWLGAYMPLLPDVAMLESLGTRGPFLMGCLQHMRVGSGGQVSDPSERVPHACLNVAPNSPTGLP